MNGTRTSGWRWHKIFSWLGLLLVLGAALGYYGWYKFFREVPQEDWITATPEMRFRYGSIGGERDAGIPYWIFYVLPRVFPEKLPGPGGYASLGVSWEQGRELPIGFTKKTVGFPRVGNTCAVCHTTNYRASTDANPVFINAGPGHTLNLVAFFRFLVDCAKDPRFNADVLMREIDLVTDLPWDDRLAYRFLIIPMTKKRLIEREKQFSWIYRKDFPDWGRGRDDSMNLTKYFMPGEHDASLDRGEAWSEFFGPTHYSFDHKGAHFIALDNVSDPAARIGEEQLAWLKADLAKQDREAPIVVLTHRPLFDLYPQWDWATRDGEQAIELLMPYRNVTVFYGHIHQEHHQMTGHIAHHAAKSLIFPLPAPGSQPKREPIRWDPAQPYRGLGYREIEAEVPRAKYTLTELPVAAA